MNDDRTGFVRDGFIGPVKLFTPSQCAVLLQHVRCQHNPAPPVWDKARGVSDRLFYDLSSRPALLARLRPLLGDDIILWAAHVVEREPGQIHAWHTDIESAAPNQRFASVWIGLENTSRESGLKFISRSHAFGKTIQQTQHENGRRRGEASDDTIVRWARANDPAATCVQPEIADGEAIIFDGRLWHATHNQRREGRRAALLLQYAAADSPVFMADLTHLEWPTRLITAPRPPCIVVSGRGDGSVNCLVPPPIVSRTPPLSTQVQSVRLPLTPTSTEPWQPRFLFHGATASVPFMSCHVSVLAPGHSPHEPHGHDDEELQIALDGEAEILLADGPGTDEVGVERLRPGTFAYYPAFQSHTIRNPQARAITYMMFKWRGAPLETKQPAGTNVCTIDGLTSNVQPEPFRARLLFEHPTAYLAKLHAHVTDLQPGAGYEPHVDTYDVAIVLLSGRVATVGRIVEPFDVIYYPAGELHGMQNIGTTPARYLVFEFHGATETPLDVSDSFEPARGPHHQGRPRANILDYPPMAVRALRRKLKLQRAQ